MGVEFCPIKLAQVPAFRLGELEVDPPTRRVSRGGRVEMLEPRVMEVLVVLAEARGAVLSRDELIARCWGGRIVGENAINRVISRVRQVSSELGADCFELETITKVGYRMVIAPQPNAVPAVPWPEADAGPSEPRRLAEAPRPASRFSRRTLIAGGAAAVAAGGAALWWEGRPPRRHTPTPAAEELFRRASLAQREGLPGQTRQAVSYFEQAVRADPAYAEAWGALALAYRHLLEGFGTAERPSLPGLMQSAARRALALDPDNADAHVALAMVLPFYRHWAPMEADLRRLLDRYPDHWLLHAHLGLLLQDVGRLDEGIEHSRRVIEIDPFLPLAHVFLARALSCADRVQEAEAALDTALHRWPAHPAPWLVKFNYLLFHGRAAAAAAFVEDPDHRPEGFGEPQVARRRLYARAVEKRAPADVAAAVQSLLNEVEGGPDNVPSAAPTVTLLGRPDLAFLWLEQFYFGGGGVPAPGRYDRRIALALFAPPFASYRQDPRYLSLLQRTGLEEYWARTGTRPDFRKPRP